MAVKFNSSSSFYQRPDGRDAAHYELLAAGGRTRLAWECLIRNEEFQVDCHAVRMGDLDAQEVADEWSLLRFKPWDEPFPANCKPRFANWVRKFPGKPDERIRRIGMSADEVAYVFNLRLMAESLDTRKSQMAMLTARLGRQLDRYVRRTGRTANVPAGSRAASEVNLHACLQVADLVTAKVPSAEIKRLVPYLANVLPRVTESRPGQRVATDSGAVNRRFVDLQTRASKFITGREYVKLLLPIDDKNV